jgi:ribosomal protein S12 methylthiotransferase
MEKNKNLTGEKISVLLENKENDYYIGRSYRDAPEIDGEILIPADNKKVELGKFYTAEIFDYNEYDLYGKFVR